MKLSDIRADRLRRALNEAKPKPVSRGPEGEHHTHAFVQRCVGSITSKNPDMDTSRAFAICQAQKKKSPEAAKEKAKEGVPAKRVGEFEKALEKGRAARNEEINQRILDIAHGRA
jgi:hypothetical protein